MDLRLPATLAGALLLSGCASGVGPSAAPEVTSEVNLPPGVCAYVDDGSAIEVAPPPTDPQPDAPTTMQMSMDIGDEVDELTIELDPAEAPCTVNSFVSLASQGYYDGTSCHRLTTQGIYVLKCGDPTGTGTGGPGYTIPDEFRPDMTYGPGTLAMAKTAAPDSGGSQFFIVYAGEDDQLPPQYTVFGEITGGLEAIVDAADQGTSSGAPDGPPAVPVSLLSVTPD